MTASPMEVIEQGIPEGFFKRKSTLGIFAPFCSKCESSEMRRLKRSMLQRLLSIQPFVCSRCKHRQSGFRFHWSVVPKALVGVTMLLGTVYLSENPPSFARQSPASGPSEADALASARTSMGGVSTIDQMLGKKPKARLDNAEILRLCRAKVSNNVILQMIRTSNGEYDVRTAAIISLREADVDQTIILAMIDSNYSAR